MFPTNILSYHICNPLLGHCVDSNRLVDVKNKNKNKQTTSRAMQFFVGANNDNFYMLRLFIFIGENIQKTIHSIQPMTPSFLWFKNLSAAICSDSFTLDISLQHAKRI